MTFQMERGKFYKQNVKYNLPVYLEEKTLKFVEKIAAKKNKDITEVVNDLLKKDMKIVGYAEK